MIHITHMPSPCARRPRVLVLSSTPTLQRAASSPSPSLPPRNPTPCSRGSAFSFFPMFGSIVTPMRTAPLSSSSGTSSGHMDRRSTSYGTPPPRHGLPPQARPQLCLQPHQGCLHEDEGDLSGHCGHVDWLWGKCGRVTEATREIGEAHIGHGDGVDTNGGTHQAHEKIKRCTR